MLAGPQISVKGHRKLKLGSGSSSTRCPSSTEGNVRGDKDRDNGEIKVF